MSSTADMLLDAALAADVPVLLWGAPGIGKTARVQQIARQRGAHLETLIGSTLDPVDVGGYLIPTKTGVRSVPAPWSTRLREHASSKGGAILFLDELSSAPAAVKSALLRVVNERRCGEVSLDGVRMVAASNPVETAADGGELDPATASRWAHLEYTVDPASWVAGTLSGWGGTPPSSVALSSICSWIQRSPAALLADAPDDSRAYPNPRAWTAAARLCDQLPRDQWRAGAAACVGPAAAGEWSVWQASLDLPDPEDLLAGRAKLPKRADQTHAALFAATQAALLDHPSRGKRLQQLADVLDTVRPDQALLCARIVARADVTMPKSMVALGLRVGHT